MSLDFYGMWHGRLAVGRQPLQQLFERTRSVTNVSRNAGGHEWDFWDWAMKQFLDWWVPEDADQGVSSGNVKS